MHAYICDLRYGVTRGLSLEALDFGGSDLRRYTFSLYRDESKSMPMAYLGLSWCSSARRGHFDGGVEGGSEAAEVVCDIASVRFQI